jgi:hypothetical protein
LRGGVLHDGGVIGPYTIAGKKGFQAPEVEKAADLYFRRKLPSNQLYDMFSKAADIASLGKILTAIAYASTDRPINRNNHYVSSKKVLQLNEDVLKAMPPKVCFGVRLRTVCTGSIHASSVSSSVV